jgi:putative ABC transport system substrate-binding protein
MLSFGCDPSGDGFMRRRDFIRVIAGSAAAWPLGARAQNPNSPTIGYFSSRSFDSEGQYRTSFNRALEEAGYVDGQNIRIEYRFSNGQDDRLPTLATDLVRQQVAVLVAGDGPSALAAKAASTTIPIVFSTGSDPVKLGLAESVNRPGGNATGVYVFVTELGPKRLQLLREIVPHATTIAFIVNVNSGSGTFQAQAMQAAAQAMGQQILVLTAATEREIDDAFATLVERKAGAIVYSANPFFQVMRDKLVALAARHSIPAIYEWPEFVTQGGLISYSSGRAEAGRQMGRYAGQILKGSKPADLPLIQSSSFELVINLKTAKALGLTVPSAVLATATDVIE